MNSLFFEQLDNAGYFKHGQVNIGKVRRVRVAEVIEMSEQSAELTSAGNLPGETSPYAHAASLSLGGGRTPCAGLECRLERANELTQFALLYSDHVYVHNFLNDYSAHAEVCRKIDKLDFRTGLLIDLMVLAQLRPSIEAGIITPITIPNACPQCLSLRSYGKPFLSRYDRSYRHLVERYTREISVTIEHQEGEFAFVAEGPELLLTHGCQVLVGKSALQFVRDRPRLRARAIRGEGVKLSTSAVKSSALPTRFAGEIRRSVAFELGAARCLNTAFVTESPMQIEFLRDLSAGLEIEDRNHLIGKYLTCFVPFIERVSADKLIKLRQNEGDAFIQFRSALTKAIDECRTSSKFTERDARALYSDVLQPKLAAIDLKVKAAQKTLLKDSAGGILAWGAAISAGLLTGMLPPDFAAMASSLGFVKVLADLGKGVLDKVDLQKGIRNNEMYFLWKVRRHAEDRSQESAVSR